MQIQCLNKSQGNYVRNWWAAVGPGRTTSRRAQPPVNTPGPTGVEGAGGICRGAGGRWRDLPRCRWAVAGPGRASRRRAERSSRRGRLAGGPPPTGTHSGRALRRPEHPWGHTATQPHGTPPRHNKTARPQWGRAAVAVALGFEPRVAVTPHSISSAAPSAARTRYLTRILYYTLPLRAQIDRAGWEQGHIAVWEQGPARSHNSTRNRRHLTI